MAAPLVTGVLAGGIIGYVVGKDRHIKPIYVHEPLHEPLEGKPGAIDSPRISRHFIDMSVGLTACEWQTQGNTLIVEKITGELYARFDDLGNESIALHEIERIVFALPFWRIFFDAPAQPGASASIIVGTGLEMHRPTQPSRLELVDLFNAALPAAETDWLTVAIRPSLATSNLRIYVCVDVAGILRIVRTRGVTTLTEDLNAGAPLVANASYIFDVLWRSGDSMNLCYSVSAGTIKRLIVNEIGGEL